MRVFADRMRVLIPLLIVAATSCGIEIITVGRTEMGRVASPDGEFNAVLVEMDPGATGASAHHVYVTKSGRKVSRTHDEPVFVATHIDGFSIQWIANRALEICINKARIFRKNSGVDVASQRISVSYECKLSKAGNVRLTIQKYPLSEQKP